MLKFPNIYLVSNGSLLLRHFLITNTIVVPHITKIDIIDIPITPIIYQTIIYYIFKIRFDLKLLYKML